jgi:hypothetical protein
MVALRIEQALPQVFGFRVLAGRFADAAERGVKRRAFGLRVDKGKPAGVSETSDFTGFREKGANLIAKAEVVGILERIWQKADGLGNFLGFANQVRQTGLAVFGLDEVIGCIVICDQTALEPGTEYLQSHFTGAGVVDVEKAESGIAGKPDVGVLAVDTPVSLVAVNDLGRADFVAYLFVDGLGSAGCRVIKSHGGSRDERKPEELAKDFTDVAIGQPEFVAQEDRRGFGAWADLAVAQFSLGGLKDGAATIRT